MSYTSLLFLVFVTATLGIYYIVPKKAQWMVLLAASYLFYCSVSFRYVGFILLTTVTTWAAALWIEKNDAAGKAELAAHKKEWDKEQKTAHKTAVKARSRRMMVACLVLNFGILCFLKYFNWLAGSLTGLLHSINPAFGILQLRLFLPLGISFYTFQSMGYLIDIYRGGKIQAEKNLFKFALFVSFFPQIVQGPIAFYNKLAHQLYEEHPIQFDNLKWGFQLIIWGCFKKLVIGDRLYVMIDGIAENWTAYTGLEVLLVILAYSVQLYADFSGGIDISRGVAQMFGVTMAENFRQPYFSKDLSEYWRRWHITLGAWVKEYLFYPIAMSKTFTKMGKSLRQKVSPQFGKVFPTSLASLITFFIIGIWHGANWKFAAFGLWNGGIIMISTLLEPQFDVWKEKLRIDPKNFLWNLFRMARTYLLVVTGLVFDIAPDTGGALGMMAKSVTQVSFAPDQWAQVLETWSLTVLDYRLLAAAMVLFWVTDLLREKTGGHLRDAINSKPLVLAWVLMLGCIMATVIFGMYGPGVSANDFVYMQF